MKMVLCYYADQVMVASRILSLKVKSVPEIL